MEEGLSALKSKRKRERQRKREREASIKGLAQQRLSYATVIAVYFLQLGLKRASMAWRQLIFVFSPTLRQILNDGFAARERACVRLASVQRRVAKALLIGR